MEPTDVIDTPETVLAETVLTDAEGQVSAEDALVEEELLVEEISIDGMCGVY